MPDMECQNLRRGGATTHCFHGGFIGNACGIRERLSAERAQFRRRFLGNWRSIRTFGDIVYDYLGATSGQLERVLPPETGTCTGDHGHASVKPMFADFGHPAYTPCV